MFKDDRRALSVVKPHLGLLAVFRRFHAVQLAVHLEDWTHIDSTTCIVYKHGVLRLVEQTAWREVLGGRESAGMDCLAAEVDSWHTKGASCFGKFRLCRRSTRKRNNLGRSKEYCVYSGQIRKEKLA